MGRDQALREHGRFWDAVATHAAPVAEARALVESLLNADEIAGRDVLDAGCGAGDFLAAFLAMNAGQVAGFDLSAVSLGRAGLNAPGAGLAIASLGALPFPAARFDVVWAWGVLHYAPDAGAVLREFARVLRPGGVLVLHTLRAGVWSSFERTAARFLSRSPRPLQTALLDAGVRLLPLVARTVGKGAPAISTSKSLRQKLHERFFVPGPVAAFRFEQLAGSLEGFDVSEAHPPVSDLFGRGMSMTIVARRHPQTATNEPRV
jgi:SAM-dependent methyltransferase